MNFYPVSVAVSNGVVDGVHDDGNDGGVDVVGHNHGVEVCVDVDQYPLSGSLLSLIPRMVAMRNGLLVLAYLVVFAVIVFSYDTWADDDLVVIGVVAAFLFTGLALWVFVAQKHRPPRDGEE